MTISQIFLLSILVPHARVFGMHVPATAPAPAPATATAPALAMDMGGPQPQPHLPDVTVTPVAPAPVHLRGIPEDVVDAAKLLGMEDSDKLEGRILKGGASSAGGHAASRGSSSRSSSGSRTITTTKVVNGRTVTTTTHTSDASDMPNIFEPLGRAYNFLRQLFETDNEAEILALAKAVKKDPSLAEKFARMEADSNAEDLAEM